MRVWLSVLMVTHGRKVFPQSEDPQHLGTGMFSGYFSPILTIHEKKLKESNSNHTLSMRLLLSLYFTQNLSYKSPPARGVSSSSLLLKVANETLICSTNLIYHPDPEFISFTSTRTGGKVQITIQLMLCFHSIEN